MDDRLPPSTFAVIPTTNPEFRPIAPVALESRGWLRRETLDRVREIGEHASRPAEPMTPGSKPGLPPAGEGAT